MTSLVLFHSALGLRPAVHSFADALRAAGHTVHVPDLDDGHVFDDLESGAAYRDHLGIESIAGRALEIAADLPEDLAYSGFSLGAAPAQLLAQTRPGARGAVLMHGALPPDAFGTPWPADVPVAVHTTEADPWVDPEVARGLVAGAADGELHFYPGAGHLFADPGDTDFDAASAQLMLARVLAFLARISPAEPGSAP